MRGGEGRGEERKGIRGDGEGREEGEGKVQPRPSVLPRGPTVLHTSSTPSPSKHVHYQLTVNSSLLTISCPLAW